MTTDDSCGTLLVMSLTALPKDIGWRGLDRNTGEFRCWSMVSWPHPRDIETDDITWWRRARIGELHTGDSFIIDHHGTTMFTVVSKLKVGVLRPRHNGKTWVAEEVNDHMVFVSTDLSSEPFLLDFRDDQAFVLVPVEDPRLGGVFS